MRLEKVRRDKVEIYVHLIWTTWDREPLISSELETEMFALLCKVIEEQSAKVVAIGGVPDHVHLLVKFSSTTRLCDLIKAAKGASSRWMNQRTGSFKWRPTYAAFSVSRWNADSLINYIRRQKEHHAAGTTKSQLEGEGE